MTGGRGSTTFTYMNTTTATTTKHSYITADKPGAVAHRFRGRQHLSEHGQWYAACGRIVPGFVEDENEDKLPVCSGCARKVGA